MTSAELIALWDARDERYLHRRAFRQPHPLSEAEIQLILLTRADEIEQLRPVERREARAVLGDWQPPVAYLSTDPEAVRSRERRAKLKAAERTGRGL